MFCLFLLISILFRQSWNHTERELAGTFGPFERVSRRGLRHDVEVRARLVRQPHLCQRRLSGSHEAKGKQPYRGLKKH